MSRTAISVERLGKYYRITQGEKLPYVTLRDTLTDALRGLFQPSRSPIVEKEFWALRELSFDIGEGERIGVIGHNGAGKSTLLKLLSRITQPSEGRFVLRGRVAALLEVGTGFHIELTGRENIYLNGTVLGMSRRDIDAKFDQIVDFAGVEDFLDTPVKRYSSGMRTRLAFAVSAHLEPDIMLIDEVLAVGDAAFQKKCLEKMEGISESGRTVIFVSHNMNAVEQFCNRVIWLDQGRLREDAQDVRQCIYRYLGGIDDLAPPSWKREDARFDRDGFVPLAMGLLDAAEGLANGFVPNDRPIRAFLEFSLDVVDPAFCIGFALYSADGELLFWTYQTDTPRERWPTLQSGLNRLEVSLPAHCLNAGEYRLTMMASLHFRAWYLQPGHDAPAFRFRIEGGLSQSPYWAQARPGVLAPVLQWDRC